MAIEVGCFSATKLTNGTINCSRCVPLSEVATTPRTELDFHSTIGVIQRLLVGKPELQIAGKGPSTSPNQENSKAAFPINVRAVFLELRAAPIALHDKNRTKRFSRLLIVVEKVRRERRWTSAGATRARKLVQGQPFAGGHRPVRSAHWRIRFLSEKVACRAAHTRQYPMG
jgi:hypothetical protein